MAYFDTVEELKKALEGFSGEEDKLSQLYKNASDAAYKAYEDEKASLAKEYRDSRNRVYSDNARDERNTYALLAERGLGFSGEAAQTKLNSNILLSNSLGELSMENARNNAALEKAHSDKKHSLSLEYLDKAGALNDEKNRLTLDIASLEQRAEADEADRIFEKEKLDAQLKAEAEANDKKLQAEAAENDKKLQAEADALDKQLKAEREMHDAELYARYYAQINSNSGSSSSSGGKGGSGSKDDLLDEVINGYRPDIDPKDLAKLMVTNATDDNFITDEKGDYLINKYLLDMFENYSIDEGYMKELIFMLKAYGYNESDVGEMRVKVISHDSLAYYDESYHKYYNKYAESGMMESDARSSARQYAKADQLDYIRARTSSSSEFIKCCIRAGINESEARAYAKKYVWSADSLGSGLRGGIGGNTVVVPMTK